MNVIDSPRHGNMVDNHQHRGNSQVMSLYERQAALAHVVVSGMTPEYAHSEKQNAMAVTASDTCIKCVVTPTLILSVKGAANSGATMHSESITCVRDYLRTAHT